MPHWGGVEDDGLVLTAVQEMHELEEGSLGAAAFGLHGVPDLL
jgi:hypothetical protein